MKLMNKKNSFSQLKGIRILKVLQKARKYKDSTHKIFEVELTCSLLRRWEKL